MKSHLLVFATGVIAGVVGQICLEEYGAAQQRAANVPPEAAAAMRALAGLADYSDETCAIEGCGNLAYIDSRYCPPHELARRLASEEESS